MRLLLPPLVCVAFCAAGVTLLPVVSYSSSSGFLYGARCDGMLEGFQSSEISAMIYGTTRGGQYEALSLGIPSGPGSWMVSASHDQVLGADFYGWGNGGDPDSSLEYDREADRLLLGRRQPLSAAVTAELGVETRHSSVFDREQGDLWQTLPALRASSCWTAGPRARLTVVCPFLPGYARASFDWQKGDGLSYTSESLERAVFAGLPTGGILALRYALGHSGGVSGTPFPFLPSLGPDELLRGYADNRFYGEWTAVANAELRHTIARFEPEEGSDGPGASIGAVLYADAGQVADGFGGIRWDRYSGDAGAGLRLGIGALLTRIDCTFISPEGLKLDLSFGESF